MSKKYIILLLTLFQLLYSVDSIRIIATANVHGEIDPCGWKKKPLGGLARKATIIDESSENIDNLYIVDAGNLFFSKESLEPGISTETALINAEIIINSFNKMGCTTLSPGSKDFAAGKSFMLSAMEKAEFPFISSNIFNIDNTLLFEPFIIEENNGLNIAFIGLSSVFESNGLTVKDPIESLNSVLDEVIPISDIRILLFSSNDVDMKKIQSANLDLTMIIRSRNKQRTFDGGAEIRTYT